MPNSMTEQEFTERFTERLKELSLTVQHKEPLILELNYGENEPKLTLALHDAYKQYIQTPDKLEAILAPFLQDLRWTAQAPRHGFKNIYDNILPMLRNFVEIPPTAEELETSKGAIVYTEVLRSPHEYLVTQFMLRQGEENIPLYRGDVIPCLPESEKMTQIAFQNLAQIIDQEGISAFPLQFESLQAQTFLVGLGDEKHKDYISALTCIPQAILSLEETLLAKEGLIAILPSRDQMLVSISVDEQSMCELGMLSKQLRDRAPYPLSSLIWKFKGGALEGVQALELEEQSPGS